MGVVDILCEVEDERKQEKKYRSATVRKPVLYMGTNSPT